MSVIVFAEQTAGDLNPGALELVTKARALGDVDVFLVGADGAAAAGPLGAHGAANVFQLDTGDALPSSAAAAALEGLIAERGATLVLFGPGNTDRDVAGRLAARMKRPVVANALDVAADGTVESEILGGTVAVSTSFTAGAPGIVVTRPKAFAPEESGGGPAAVTAVAVPDTGHSGSATVTEQHVEESDGPDLEAAAVVIAGGRGLGSAEKFEMMDELASLLDGAVGGTRAVVDAGWVPYSYQIGQTGKTVKPSVYIACGVSGAMQHVVGMKGSSTIIAINKDPEAPIFGLADLGIVGDVHAVVPKLIDALKARS